MVEVAGCGVERAGVRINVVKDVFVMGNFRGGLFFFKPVNDRLWCDRFCVIRVGPPEHVKGV